MKKTDLPKGVFCYYVKKKKNWDTPMRESVPLGVVVFSSVPDDPAKVVRGISVCSETESAGFDYAEGRARAYKRYRHALLGRRDDYPFADRVMRFAERGGYMSKDVFVSLPNDKLNLLDFLLWFGGSVVPTHKAMYLAEPTEFEKHIIESSGGVKPWPAEMAVSTAAP